MILYELELTSFKNHSDQKFNFETGVNCVLGKNGIGKTNLLDSINYLAFARTALNGSDAQSIREKEKSFVIRGKFGEDQIIACGYEFRKGKTLKINGKEQVKISDHVGQVPLVFTNPDDSDLIREGSEFRRKFFDGTLAQIDRNYLQNLIVFQRTLKQRNEHLKSSVNGIVDHRLLDTYDETLISKSKELSNRRKLFLEDYIPSFKQAHKSLHPIAEEPTIDFSSEVLEADFKEKYRQSRDRDIILQRTLLGSHRDSYDFKLDDQLIRKFGSQGQQKTFIISLRLAEYDILKSKLNKSPILLLDDIFDRLDDDRIGRLVDLLSDSERFEQIFITDARKERSKKIFNKKAANFIELK